MAKNFTPIEKYNVCKWQFFSECIKLHKILKLHAREELFPFYGHQGRIIDCMVKYSTLCRNSVVDCKPYYLEDCTYGIRTIGGSPVCTKLALHHSTKHCWGV